MDSEELRQRIKISMDKDRARRLDPTSSMAKIDISSKLSELRPATEIQQEAADADRAARDARLAPYIRNKRNP